MVHAFDVYLAETVGLEPALILQYFYYWTQYNDGNPNMKRDGVVWFFCSRSTIKKVFPYLSEQKIRSSIDKLIDGGFVVKREVEGKEKGKANWYYITEKALFHFVITAPIVDNGIALAKATKGSVNSTNGLVNSTNIVNNIDNNKDNNNKHSIEDKRAYLRSLCEPYLEKYGRSMIEDFILYWGETDGKELRCEREKRKDGMFEVGRRLAYWYSRNKNRYGGREQVAPAQQPKKPARPIWEQFGMTYEQYVEYVNKEQ